MSALGLLVTYSSSSDEHSDSEPASKHRKFECSSTDIRRLPLPPVFNKKPLETPEHIDEPEKHNGRIRNYPHERGNWSTYVYVQYVPSKSLFSFINKLLEKCLSIDEFNLIDDFHISLSRTVVLKFHWINNFVSSLKESLFTVKRFSITLDTLAVYCNDEKSRTFIGLKVSDDCCQELKTIVNKTDVLLDELQLKTFYEDPSFHISLLWCLGDKQEEINNIISSLQLILDKTLVEETDIDDNSLFYLDVDAIICKTGNKCYNFELK